MEWTQWLPLIAGIIALAGAWGTIQHRLGRLEARIDGLERGQAEAKSEREAIKTENIRLHEETRAEFRRMQEETRAEFRRMQEETRAEFRREIRLGLQALREHTHADGSPATTPIPVPADVDAD